MSRKSSSKKKPTAKSTSSPDRVLVDLEKIPSRVVVEGLPVRDHLAVVSVRGRDVMYDCGHTYAEAFQFDVYGSVYAAGETVPKITCGDCTVKEFTRIATRCGRCHGAIVPGDGVALYGYNEELFKATKDQPWFKPLEDDKGRKSVIGCLAMKCCPSGGFFAGNWTEEGFKPRFEDGLSIAAQAMATGEVQIASID